jgi:preprotein translocase subunit YajC
MRDAALPFAVLLVFGLLLIRRGARQRRGLAETQSSVVVGAQVMTTSGLFAIVVALDDEAVTLQTGPGQQSRWDRRAVARVLDRPSGGPEAAAENAQGYPGGTHSVTEAADSSPTVAPIPTPDLRSAPDLTTEPPAAPPVRPVPDRQPPSDDLTPRGSA